MRLRLCLADSIWKSIPSSRASVQEHKLAKPGPQCTYSSAYKPVNCNLLYLISKCALAIGRNRVTWQSINLASALTIAFIFMDVSLIFLNNIWNHSTDMFFKRFLK